MLYDVILEYLRERYPETPDEEIEHMAVCAIRGRLPDQAVSDMAGTEGSDRRWIDRELPGF